MRRRPPSLRSDAVRNRDRVLEAAAAVFAEGGTDATTETTARRAGVGAGTVFRHFPTKQDLLEAVLQREFERLSEVARRFLEIGDPGEALFEALRCVFEGSAARKAVATALDAGVDIRGSAWARPFWETLGELLLRAQATGAARQDVGVLELMAVTAAASRAAEFAGQDRALRERVVGVVFDGLRRASVVREPRRRSRAVRS